MQNKIEFRVAWPGDFWKKENRLEIILEVRKSMEKVEEITKK